jgi:hypothetical protein
LLPERRLQIADEREHGCRREFLPFETDAVTVRANHVRGNAVATATLCSVPPERDVHPGHRGERNARRDVSAARACIEYPAESRLALMDEQFDADVERSADTPSMFHGDLALSQCIEIGITLAAANTQLFVGRLLLAAGIELNVLPAFAP